MKTIELARQTFGRWTVIRRAENTDTGQAQWVCQCQCGNTKTLKSIVIRRGLSQSCGCLKREQTVRMSTKHGHSTGGISPTYHSWVGMKARCTNPKHDAYPRYGARGITVAERWMTFTNFLADMGEKPPGTSLDRIDSARGYEPGNCRWSGATTQSRNRPSFNRLITYDGKTQTMAEWAEQLGVHPATLSYRAGRGWTDTEIIGTPVKKPIK